MSGRDLGLRGSYKAPATRHVPDAFNLRGLPGLWLSDAGRLCGDQLPPALFPHIDVDTSGLKADLLTAHLHFERSAARHYRRVAISAHLNVIEVERLELTGARFHLGETLGLCLDNTESVGEGVIVSPYALKRGDIIRELRVSTLQMKSLNFLLHVVIRL